MRGAPAPETPCRLLAHTQPCRCTSLTPLLSPAQVDAARGEREYYAGVSFVGDIASLGGDRGFSLDLAAPQVRSPSRPRCHTVSLPPTAPASPTGPHPPSPPAPSAQAMFCCGDMINTLIRCGAHAYLEFKAVEASFILLNGSLLARGPRRRAAPPAAHCAAALRPQLAEAAHSRRLKRRRTQAHPPASGAQAVPASRSEVFQSTALSAVDKRVLMRFLKARNSPGHCRPAARCFFFLRSL